jgi:hypothetical protein
LSLCRRERVKRAKKAENKAESKADSISDKDAGASTKPTAAVVAGVPNGEMQKRPDLKELSKDLPSGWQVLLTRETGLCHNLIQCELSSWGMSCRKQCNVLCNHIALFHLHPLDMEVLF